MIMKEDVLADLRRYFDLNLYEVRLWAALLSRGVSTAGELSDIANVPRSRSYDVLESLEKKGFVVMKTGKPIKYIAVPPSEVVDRVKKNMHAEALDKINRLNSIKDSSLLTELDSLHKNGISMVDPAEMSGCLKGRHNVYNHLDYLIKKANSDVSIVTTEKGFIRKAEGLKHSLSNASKRGVKIRIAAPISKENKHIVEELNDIAEIKHNESIEGRFMSVDNEHLVFMTHNDAEVHPSYDLGIWMQTPYLTKSINTMFTQVWKTL